MASELPESSLLRKPPTVQADPTIPSADAGVCPQVTPTGLTGSEPLQETLK